MSDADDKYTYNYQKPCVTVAKHLRTLGVECFVNDSSKIVYNKEVNRYIIQPTCIINVTSINTARLDKPKCSDMIFG